MAEKRTKAEKEQRKANYLEEKFENHPETETGRKKPPKGVRRGDLIKDTSGALRRFGN